MIKVENISPCEGTFELSDEKTNGRETYEGTFGDSGVQCCIWWFEPPNSEWKVAHWVVGKCNSKGTGEGYAFQRTKATGNRECPSTNKEFLEQWEKASGTPIRKARVIDHLLRDAWAEALSAYSEADLTGTGIFYFPHVWPDNVLEKLNPCIIIRQL